MPTSILPGFHNLPASERLRVVAAFAGLSNGDVTALTTTGSLDLAAAGLMIENVIGTLELPLGIGTNFRVNGRDRLIPMAIEEASVVAAASYGAKLCLPEGFAASADRSVMRGMVQLVNVPDMAAAIAAVAGKKSDLLALCRDPTSSLVRMGGGIFDLATRTLETRRGRMLIVDLFCDCRDAMGANTVNTAAEKLAPHLEQLTGGTRRLMIISNLADQRLVRAEAVWRKERLGGDLIEGILDAHAFAEADPYRCATHNKGIMNGIDAVALATGQDFRALEAGTHTFACRSGRYQPLTSYAANEAGDLVGSITLPLAVGVVGGSVRTNPIAQACLNILGAQTAQDLAMAMAAVGLAQNFAALRAQVAEGIQHGHMQLHARNIAIQAGATGGEVESLADALVAAGQVGVSRARALLQDMRGKNK